MFVNNDFEDYISVLRIHLIFMWIQILDPSCIKKSNFQNVPFLSQILRSNLIHRLIIQAWNIFSFVFLSDILSFGTITIILSTE